jgi:carboxypeptidase D
MNPDGHESDTRLNSNGYDLNRNFPLDAMPYDPPSAEPSDNDSDTVKTWRDTGAGTVQPEVAAVIEWSKQHNFVLSASMHQGALVANYPHDACDTQVSCSMLACSNFCK